MRAWNSQLLMVKKVMKKSATKSGGILVVQLTADHSEHEKTVTGLVDAAKVAEARLKTAKDALAEVKAKL